MSPLHHTLSARDIFLILVVTLAACDGERDRGALLAGAACDDIGAAYATMDSAAVAVVTSRAPVWSAARSPRVSRTPAVSIGVVLGGMDYEFGRISSATRLTDGRIVVGDQQAAHLKVFDPAGRYLRTVGGRGSGPGEYRSVSAILSARGDTLWVEDLGARRITTLDPGFVVIETIAMTIVPWSQPPRTPGGRGRSGQTVVRPRGVLHDGALIATSLIGNPWADEVTGVSRGTIVLRRTKPATGRMDSLGVMLGTEYFQYFTQGSVTFGDAPLGFVESLAIASDRYYQGDAERFEIEEHAPDGRLVRLIRVCEERDAIDDRRLDEVIAERLAGFSAAELTHEEPAYRGIEWSRVAPSYLELRVDRADQLWARDFTYPGDAQRWKVFDRDGRWLGDVETPAELTVLEIGSDYILGRHTADLGVQSVRLHTLSG